MGIQSELVRKYFANPAEGCPLAFNRQGLIRPGAIVTYDLMIKMHRMGYKQTFTTRVACQRLWEIAMKYLRSMRASVFVYCVDQGQLVPREKLEEQKMRDEHAKKRETYPYPERSELTWEGIVEHPGGPVQLLDLGRLARSRTLRPLLWKRMLQYMKERTDEIPVGSVVIWDHFMPGAHFFTCKDGHWVDPSTRHIYGEADMAMLYWIHRFRRRGCDSVVVTVDTDQVPLLTHYAQCVKGPEHPGNLVWEKDEQQVDIKELTRWMRRDKKWSDDRFLKVICMCGTDFVNKAHMFYRIGNRAVFDALMDQPGLLRRLFTPDDPDTGFKNFVTLVCAVWSKKYKENKVRSNVYWRKKYKTFPKVDKLKYLYNRLAFNIRYWAIQWMDPSVCPQDEPSLEPMAHQEGSTNAVAHQPFVFVNPHTCFPDGTVRPAYEEKLARDAVEAPPVVAKHKRSPSSSSSSTPARHKRSRASASSASPSKRQRQRQTPAALMQGARSPPPPRTVIEIDD